MAVDVEMVESIPNPYRLPVLVNIDEHIA